MSIKVNPDVCSGCGLCVTSCPQGIFELKDGKSHAVHNACLECHLCEMICENGAITLVRD